VFKRPVLLFLAAAPLLATAVDYAAEGKLWWAHIQFLADDKLQGRNIGTDEFRQAVEYVSGQFRTLGLKPAGTAGYLQPIKFESRQLVQEESSLTLIRDGKEEPLTLGADATLSARADLAPKLEAPMVFAGYGLVIPEAHWDELAGLDLKGKIAVYVKRPRSSRGAGAGEIAPHVRSGTLAHAPRRRRDWHRYHRRGPRWPGRSGRRRTRWTTGRFIGRRQRTTNRSRARNGRRRAWRAAAFHQSGRSYAVGNQRHGRLPHAHGARRGQALRRLGPHLRRNSGAGARQQAACRTFRSPARCARKPPSSATRLESSKRRRHGAGTAAS
jgi:hypothetical protein